MNYKHVLLVFGSLVCDLLIGVFMPALPPLTLLLVAFYLAIKLPMPMALSLILPAGFLFDIAQNSNTCATIFIFVEVIIVAWLSNRYLDFSNKLNQVGFILLFMVGKNIAFWLISIRQWPSSYLESSIVINLVLIFAYTIALIISDAKKT